METLLSAWPVEHMECGSLEVQEPLLDITDGMGDWVHEPVEPKLASKLTSEPELWEHSSEDKLLDMEVGVLICKPDLVWQCFNIFPTGGG